MSEKYDSILVLVDFHCLRSRDCSLHAQKREGRHAEEGHLEGRGDKCR